MPRGTSTRQIRVDPELWDAFGDAVKVADPETDRSAVLRAAMRWVVANPRAIDAIRQGATTETKAP